MKNTKSCPAQLYFASDVIERNFDDKKMSHIVVIIPSFISPIAVFWISMQHYTSLQQRRCERKESQAPSLSLFARKVPDHAVDTELTRHFLKKVAFVFVFLGFGWTWNDVEILRI